MSFLSSTVRLGILGLTFSTSSRKVTLEKVCSRNCLVAQLDDRTRGSWVRSALGPTSPKFPGPGAPAAPLHPSG